LKVPGYVRWPAKLKAGHVVEQATAHIDVVPTLLEACGATPAGPLDGRSLLPLLTGAKPALPDRTLFYQWHRGDVPEKGRAFAAIGPKYKLVQAAGVPQGAKWQPKYELFDLPADPFEQTDLAAKLPAEVARLKGEYEAWFADVSKAGFAPPRIVVGSDKQPLVRLTKQDWRVTKGDGWGTEGHWLVNVERAGMYKVTIRNRQPFTEWTAEIGGQRMWVPSGRLRRDDTVPIRLHRGPATILARVTVGGQQVGADYVEVEWAGK
jgi:hypothetical protein